MSGRIYLSLDGSVARFRVHVPGERYEAFLRASDGARYDWEHRGRVATLDKIPGILMNLREAGFDVRLTEDLQVAVKQRDAQQWYEFESAKDRMDRIDTAMFKANGRKIFAYQRMGILWLSFRTGAVLADDMGLGKTLQSIVALPTDAPVLVICPAVSRLDWRTEIRAVRPNLKVSVLAGRDSFRFPMSGEVVIVNYEILPEVHDTKGINGRVCGGFLPPKKCQGCRDEMVETPKGPIISKTAHQSKCTGFLQPVRCLGCSPLLDKVSEGTVVIIDEAHRIKKAKTGWTIKCRAIARTARNKKGRTWLLTGTPIENSPEDLWSLFVAAGVEGEAFGNWDRFKMLFDGKTVTKHGHSYGHEWGIPDSDEIKDCIQRVALRRLKVDVLPDLPSKRWSQIEVEVDRDALKKCDAFLKMLGKDVEDLARLIEREEIDFKVMSSVRTALAIAKIPAMMERVQFYEEQGVPLIVFSAHRAPIDALELRKGWGVITGDVKNKFDVKEAFQQGKLKGLGITIASGGTGLTLTRASRAIFVDLGWKPTENEQAEDRLMRIGQTNACIYEILMANHPLDERVTQVLHGKRGLITMSVDAARSTDNGPGDEKFEKEFLKLRAEVACGEAPRRDLSTATEEEKKAIEDLHRPGVQYESRNDARLAMDLAQQATMIGLSDKQWWLAIQIAAKGVMVEETTDEVLESLLPDGASAEQLTKGEAYG